MNTIFKNVVNELEVYQDVFLLIQSKHVNHLKNKDNKKKNIQKLIS